jgi:hypothetical protein
MSCRRRCDKAADTAADEITNLTADTIPHGSRYMMALPPPHLAADQLRNQGLMPNLDAGLEKLPSLQDGTKSKQVKSEPRYTRGLWTLVQRGEWLPPRRDHFANSTGSVDDSGSEAEDQEAMDHEATNEAQIQLQSGGIEKKEFTDAKRISFRKRARDEGRIGLSGITMTRKRSIRQAEAQN